MSVPIKECLPKAQLELISFKFVLSTRPWFIFLKRNRLFVKELHIHNASSYRIFSSCSHNRIRRRRWYHGEDRFVAMLEHQRFAKCMLWKSRRTTEYRLQPCDHLCSRSWSEWIALMCRKLCFQEGGKHHFWWFVLCQTTESAWRCVGWVMYIYWLRWRSAPRRSLRGVK